MTQQSQVAQDWQKFILAYFNNQLNTFRIKPKKNLGTHKIIWQYWGQGIDDNLPLMVKLCFNSIDRNKGDYQVIRLTDETLADY